MHPVLFELGPLTVYAYGLFVVLAFVVSVAIISILARQARLPVGRLSDYALYGVLAALIGARVAYLFLRPDEAGSFFSWFAIGGGRLALVGGITAGLAMLTILFRRNRVTPEDTWRWFDVVAIGTVAGLAVGRIGSFLNGDLLGGPTGLPWGVSYNDRPALTAADQALHPLALYAAALYAGIAAYGYRLWKLRPTALRPGLIFWTLLFLVGAVQVVLEPLHQTTEALYAGDLRASIVTGLTMMALSVWALVSRYQVGNRVAR